MQFEDCLGCDIGFGLVLFEFVWLFNDVLGV